MNPSAEATSSCRRLLLACATALVCAGLPAFGQAQTQAPVFAFPSKTVRIVVPFAAGGVGDLTARTVGQELSKLLGQGVVIENRPGAGGVVAAETVARAEPDGHTLLLMSNGTAVSAGLFAKLPFDTVRDFAPVSTLGTFDIAVVAGAESAFKTLGDVIAFAKANPGKLNVGSINIGSTQHLTAELFKATADIDVQVVPFNGTPALINALRGRQVDVAVEILGPTLTHVKAGALRVLATTGTRRASVLPDVPTAREAGVKDLVASSWNALAAPAKTPRAVVDRLARDVATALASAEVKQKLANLNVDAQASTPEQTAELLAADIKRWTGVIDRAGIPRQ
jgi:tripartite-type tricarboxylate transporter receptor subunit TctC